MLLFASSLLILFSLHGQVVTQIVTHYCNIVPSLNHPCPSDSCLTLSQFYANPNDFLQRTTTLIFQPGNYFVNQNLAINGIINFSMIKDNNSLAESKVEIICTAYESISFRAVDYVHISGLNVEYIGLEVRSVGQFVVSDCVFA